MSHELITGLFMKYFDHSELKKQSDSAILPAPGKYLAFTTDAYVVDPVFFPGGNIGHLAVCGTINDLAVAGAKPLYMTASFIIEEGLALGDLEEIVKSMAREAKNAGVAVVAGDTKVVDRNKCDKIFITTSGVGEVRPEFLHLGTAGKVVPGDVILINGHIADHGMAVMAARESLSFSTGLSSDSASLSSLIGNVLETSSGIRFMRDATRGGLATVLAELAGMTGLGIDVREEKVPVREEVRGMCEVLGFDPMYVANEGKVVLVVDPGEANKIMACMKEHPLGKFAAMIGEITGRHAGQVVLETAIGGKRIMDMLAGEQLPRIC